MQLLKTDRGGDGRNSQIDLLKFCAAFLVVCIHTPIPREASAHYMTLTRIGVPIFLMISGFFYNEKRISKEIKKILSLLIISNVLYLAIHIVIAVFTHNMENYVKSLFTMENVLNLILFNESPIHFHLWYLGTILYVEIIAMIIGKFFKGSFRILYCITPILLIGDLLLGKYSLLLFHREFSYIIVRNWIFVGIPYFIIGIWLSNNWNSVKKNYKRWVNWIFVLLFCLTSILEHWILVKCNCNSARDHYLSTTFLAISVFILFVMKEKGQEKNLSLIGRKYSTWIYILHPVFIIFLDAVASRINITTQYLFIRPILVFTVTIAFLLLCTTCYRRLLPKLMKKE